MLVGYPIYPTTLARVQQVLHYHGVGLLRQATSGKSRVVRSNTWVCFKAIRLTHVLSSFKRREYENDRMNI